MQTTEFFGNTRLLYLEAPALPHDLYSFHQRVLQDIESLVNLSPLNRLIWVYFFAPSKTSDFSNYETWVGQEVIGPLNKEMLKNGIEGFSKMADFDAGPTFNTILKLNSLDDFNWETILKEEQTFRQNCKATLAETWRVALPWTKSENIENIQIQLQFFEKVR